jgi:chromosome segregation ATPase
VIKTRLAEDPNVQALERDLAAARAMDGQLSKEEDALKKQLYKLRDEVKSTPEVQQAREAAQQAEQAYYNMPRTHPKFVAAQQAIRDAQQALQARIRDLPEKKALDAAQRAYAELRNNSPEIRQAREAREAARQAYEQAIEHAIRTSAQGAAITRRLEEIDEQDELAEAQQRSIQEDLERVRSEAQKADPEIAKAQKAYSEAHAKYKQVMQERAGDEAKALAEARQDLGKRLHDKMTTDATILDLQDRLKKVEQEINALYGQQRELYRKNAANRQHRRGPR